MSLKLGRLALCATPPVHPPTFFYCIWHTISVLYRAHLYMKCSLGISDFLEEISSLSNSVVFLYFFALIAEEGFLISSCYSLELCIQMLKLLKYKLKTNIMNRVLLKLYNNLQNISSILSKNCLKKGSLCGKWEGSSRGRGHMISYG